MSIDIRLAPGDKVQFDHERQRYTVQAVSADGRYAVCTKPFNVRRTVIYTIVDFQRGVRGPDDRVFSEGYETREECEAAVGRLERDEMAVSRRRDLPLNITEVFARDRIGGAK